MDIGSAVSRAAGVTEAQLRDLYAYQTSPAFTPLERLVLQFAEALTRTPADVPDDLFAALREYLSEGALVELTATIAWENYRSRFNRAFAVEPQGFSEGAYCALPVRPD